MVQRVENEFSKVARNGFYSTSEIIRSDPYKILAALLLLAWTGTALLAPIVAYDDWNYHLPFAARLWGIGGSDSFHFGQYLENRWQGFPKLWEWLEGLAWRLTGSLRFAIVPQLVICWIYFWLLFRAIAVPWKWLVLGFFASPMLLLHFQGLHVDLAAGVCLALGFIFFVMLVHSDCRSAPAALGAVLFLGMAGNIKVQALIAAVLIVVVVIAMGIARLRWRTATARIVAVGAISILVASATAISNTYRTGNLFYPLNVEVAGHTVFPGPEDPMHHAFPPNYGGYAGMVVPPNPVSFILSITELDWTIRGVAPRYSIASRTGDRPSFGGPSRTGGWGSLFVLLNGFVLVCQLINLRKEADPMQRSLVIGTSALIVATSFLPRSHELRYWLFLPLILLPVNLRYLSRTVSPKLLGGGLLSLMLYGTALVVLTPATELIKARFKSEAPLPPQIASALRKYGRYCGDHELLFRYSTAVTGQPRLLSLRKEDCDPRAG